MERPAGGVDGSEGWLPGRPCLTLLSAPVKTKFLCLSVWPSVRPSVCLSACLSVCLSVCCLGKASGGVWWVWRLAARSAVPNVAFCPCKNKVSVSVCPSVRLSVCLPVCLSVCCLGKASGGFDGFEGWLPGRPCLTLLSAPVKTKFLCLSVWPSVRPSVCLSACLSVCLLPWKGQQRGSDGFEGWLPGRPCLTLLSAPVKNKVSVSVCLPACLSVCLPACLSVCLFVALERPAGGFDGFEGWLPGRPCLTLLSAPVKTKFLCLSVWPSVRPSVCLPVCLSVCLLPWKGQRGGLMGLKAGCQVGRA